MKEIELFKSIEAQLKQDKRVVLMIVVQSLGSSPGRPGFKMSVAEDKTLFGSIGGGLMEVNLVEIAKDFLSLDDDEATEKFGHPFVFAKYQDHRTDRPNYSGMICSGKQTVIFCKIEPSDLDELQSIINSLVNNNQGVLLISKNGLQVITPKMNQFAELWNMKERFYFVAKERRLDYLEKLGYKRNLFIIGGGHCALALSEIMSKMDFQITVFDDRPNLNTLEKNKFAHRVEILESYEKIADFVPSGEENYVVVMTLGYKFDEIVIRQLFDKDFKYFGVLGSKAKMKTLLKSLEKEGFDKNRLGKIRTPIGLPINSHTPEEIAVSIAAEIISVKNN
jgi:xanthine dehydrogenase accessory factor